MSSWKLLTNLIVFWNAVENPVFLRTTRYPPVWYAVYARLVNASGFMLAAGGLSCYLATLIAFYLNSLLVLLIPVMLLWTLLVGMTLAPVIVGEREHRTWETLLATPLPVETIVLGKASGALWWLRDAIRIMMGLLVLSAGAIGLVGLILTPAGSGADPDALPSSVLCAATLVVPLAAAGLFVVDRAQYFVLTVVAALAASTTANTNRAALSAASTAAFAVWLVDAGLSAGALVLLPGDAIARTSGDTLALATLGPFVGFMAELSLGRLALFAGGTLLIREVLVRVLWRWTLHRARAA